MLSNLAKVVIRRFVRTCSDMKRRGTFVVVEGCDRCGKTTQCKLVAKKLNDSNVSTQYLKFPERSTILGILINKYLTKELTLDDYEIHVLFTLNRWEFVNEMKKHLDNGTSLIVDRYSYSGVAYSAIKKGMDQKFCFFTELGLPKPDLVIFLDGSISTALRRNGFGEEIYEQKEVQEHVKDFYKKHFFPMMKVVDAEGSIDEVNERLMKVIADKVENTILDELGVLTWKDLEVFSEEDRQKYEHVRVAIEKAVEILESCQDDSDKLEQVLQLVKSCSSKVLIQMQS